MSRPVSIYPASSDFGSGTQQAAKVLGNQKVRIRLQPKPLTLMCPKIRDIQKCISAFDFYAIVLCASVLHNHCITLLERPACAAETSFASPKAA
jgi:hypothetical protein